MNSCPLCLSTETQPLRFSDGRENYRHCLKCDLRFLVPHLRLSPDQEKERYLQHNNDLNDPHYQNFVRPLFEALVRVIPSGAKGLDYGAGTGPVLSEMFRAHGYEVKLYDPYFWPDVSVLDEKYDFIFACEVVEHFYSPHEEFSRLKKMLVEGGALGFMTALYSSEMNFEEWYYRRDPTHVCFYSERTMHWLSRHLGFEICEVKQGRVITLQS